MSLHIVSYKNPIASKRERIAKSNSLIQAAFVFHKMPKMTEQINTHTRIERDVAIENLVSKAYAKHMRRVVYLWSRLTLVVFMYLVYIISIGVVDANTTGMKQMIAIHGGYHCGEEAVYRVVLAMIKAEIVEQGFHT